MALSEEAKKYLVKRRLTPLKQQSSHGKEQIKVIDAKIIKTINKW